MVMPSCTPETTRCRSPRSSSTTRARALPLATSWRMRESRTATSENSVAAKKAFRATSASTPSRRIANMDEWAPCGTGASSTLTVCLSRAGVNLRTFLRILLWVVGIFVVAVGAVAWWFVYRPLPQIDGTASLLGLQHDVTVERDQWGVPHIRAASLEDLEEAPGYVMAQERLWQMDLLRRVARGRLSEILGPATLSIDKDFRTLGLSRAAARDVAQLDAESRKLMEAYARGVNTFIEEHQDQLPLEFTLLHYKPLPWQPSDTLAISG